MFYTKSSLPVKSTLFRRKIVVPDNETINRAIAVNVKQLEYRARTLGWDGKKLAAEREAIQLGLFSRIKRWFGTHFTPKCKSIVAVAAISEIGESPSFYVGDEGDECAAFYSLFDESRKEEIARILEGLGMKKAKKAEVTATTPAGTFMGELDVDVAKKLEDRLGYGCEVWFKEERP